MTATDELRRMLDERGVEWEPSVFDQQHETFYSTENGVGIIVTEFPETQRMSFSSDMRITPKQAIETTLGRGTCRLEREPDSDRLWWCSNCRSYHEHVSEFPWEYCPRCGAKVVD